MKKSYQVLLSAFCVLLSFSCASAPAATAKSPAISPGKIGTIAFKPPGYVRGDRNTRAKRVIIFIHGVFGDGTSTWQNRANGAYFPALVASDETFEGVDIWVHEFDTPKLRQSYTIDELADHLRRYLSNDNVVANHDEIIFVAHSMGGLVARAYLLKYREMPPERVRMMYFFSTPTTGSDIASLARLISDNPQLSDMRKMTTVNAGVLVCCVSNTVTYRVYSVSMAHARCDADYACRTRERTPHKMVSWPVDAGAPGPPSPDCSPRC